MERSTLIQNAIKEAYAKQEQNTITDENGWKTRFVIKNKTVWMQIISDRNEITSNNKVYKLDTNKPYTRSFSKYWYLSEDEKAIAQRLYKEIA